MKKNLSKFKRVTDLFERGQEVVLQEEPEPILVWVNKLNPFEMEEARRDGSVGRSRALLGLDDPDSPEMAIFNQALEGRTTEEVVRALVYAKQNEDYVEVLDDIRADESWKDRLNVLERGDQQLRDGQMPEDAEEQDRLAKLNGEYMTEIDKRLTAKQEERKNGLSSLSHEEVTDLYRESYRDNAGSQGFLTEYRVTEMYYALRDCQATVKGPNGQWDHSGCDHKERLCDSRADIKQLPEGLIVVVRDAISALNMTPRDAGNSDAPASSSASSEQPGAEADSTPSTQTGT